MDKQEAVTRLQKIKEEVDYLANGYDEEDGHIEADQVLIDFLRGSDAEEVADAFKAIPKWYA